MTTQEFKNKYESFRNTELRDNFVTGIINTSYVPFHKKIAICEKIINSTVYKDVLGKKVFSINSNANHMLYILSLIDTYTDIEIDFSKGLDEYELLDEMTYEHPEYGITSLLQFIIQERISPLETAAFNSIMENCLSDTIAKENDVLRYIDDKLSAIKMTFSALGESIIEEVKKNISKEDIATIVEAIKQQVKN